MLGTALRLIAAGEASRRLGDYLRKLTARYLVLSAAGIVFLIAVFFALLAGFWALDLWTHNPIWAALIMAGSLFLAGSLIALTAYGLTRRKPQTAKPAMEPRLHAAQSSLPTVEDVGRQIEEAARQYGPFRVTAAAAAGGLVAGVLVKRLTQPRAYAPARGRQGRRRYS
jgi:hypothetical protein